jgi:carbon monoxide dehydrogenase subunit G
MTVRVERVFELPAPPADVWAFIADPEQRARSISVVVDHETNTDDSAVWQVELPIPRIDRTVTIETEDVRREDPEFVKFVGRSRALDVQGEHTLEKNVDGGTRLTNRFVVDGHLPGVETYFKRTLDSELENLEAAAREALSA